MLKIAGCFSNLKLLYKVHFVVCKRRTGKSLVSMVTSYDIFTFKTDRVHMFNVMNIETVNFKYHVV